MQFLLLSFLTGYLLGSIPTAYLFGRWLRGIDLRVHGSGTVSGTSVYYHVAPWAAFLVWVLDCAKGVLPAWLGYQLDPGPGAAVAGGVGAILGHNWSLFLGMKGGRGISAFEGMLLVVFPAGFLAVLASLLIGRIARASGEFTLLAIAVLALPIWSDSQPVQAGCVAMLVITLVKRLEANRLSLPSDSVERWKVMARRAFSDRDVSESESWVQRRPEDQK